MDTLNTHRIQALCLFFTLGICLSRTGVSAAVVAQEEEFTIDEKSVTMCFEGACDKRPLDDINKTYPNSFSSQEDAEKRTGLNYDAYVEKISVGCRSCQQRFRSDFDRCCPTWRFVTSFNDAYSPLRDITNRWCYIIQIPFFRLYQYISVGICGPSYRCKRCVQQYTIQSLLAWCPGSFGIQMRHFPIPTYCSCQSCRNYDLTDKELATSVNETTIPAS